MTGFLINAVIDSLFEGRGGTLAEINTETKWTPQNIKVLKRPARAVQFRN